MTGRARIIEILLALPPSRRPIPCTAYRCAGKTEELLIFIYSNLPMSALIAYATAKKKKRPKLFSAVRDVEELKNISILRVADELGISLMKIGGGSWAVRTPGENSTCSLTIFEKTNSFVRFSGKEQGGCRGGSTIDLVRHWTNNASVRDACDFLKKIR